MGLTSQSGQEDGVSVCEGPWRTVSAQYVGALPGAQHRGRPPVSRLREGGPPRPLPPGGADAGLPRAATRGGACLSRHEAVVQPGSREVRRLGPPALQQRGRGWGPVDSL